MNTRRAFTVVELLAVVGIILIIMSLIIPSVSKAMEKSNLTAAKAVLEKIEMAIRNYQAAYGKWPQDLSYQFLGQKLPSYNFGAVLPLLQYEKDQMQDPNAGDARVYKDPWDQAFCYYWIGQNPIPFQNDYNALVAAGSFLNPASGPNHLDDVQVTINAQLVLVPGFLLWSKGPDTISGGANGADDIGNWGKTRNKMVSGV